MHMLAVLSFIPCKYLLMRIPSRNGIYIIDNYGGILFYVTIIFLNHARLLTQHSVSSKDKSKFCGLAASVAGAGEVNMKNSFPLLLISSHWFISGANLYLGMS